MKVHNQKRDSTPDSANRLAGPPGGGAVPPPPPPPPPGGNDDDDDDNGDDGDLHQMHGDDDDGAVVIGGQAEYDDDDDDDDSDAESGSNKYDHSSQLDDDMDSQSGSSHSFEPSGEVSEEGAAHPAACPPIASARVRTRQDRGADRRHALQGGRRDYGTHYGTHRPRHGDEAR
jgi:hypothetical protein